MAVVEEIPPLLSPGTRIGDRYVVGDILGRGGTGAVYEAFQAALGRRVAIKVVHGVNPLDRERFRREAMVAASIDHPHVVRVFDGGFDDGVGAYLVMELLSGDHLVDVLIARRALPLTEVIAWLAPVASALDAIHRHGLLHRDVKPENIVCTEVNGSSVVKLVDFGLAVHIDGRDRLTREGVISGTPHYVAPEVAVGERESVQSDLYSLAAVAYELLSGRAPHNGTTAMEVLRKKVTERSPSVSSRRTMFTVGVETAFARALDIDPIERHPSCGAFLDDLRQCLEQ